MKASSFVKGMILAASSVMMVACGGPSATDIAIEQAKNVDQLLTSSGVDWMLVKTFSKVSGYSVYYNPSDNKYYALDRSKYVAGMTYDAFMGAAQVYSGLGKSSRNYQSYEVISETTRRETKSSSISCGATFSSSCREYKWSDGSVYRYEWEEDVVDKTYGYVTRTETIYTEPNSGIVFEVGANASKDLEAMSAAIEMAGVEMIRDTIMNDYGLSEDRAQEIASLASSWQNLEKSRAMTQKDLVEFQSQVFGADLGSISKAAKKAVDGDTKDFNALVKKAAAMNNISPEQAKKIVNTFVQ